MQSFVARQPRAFDLDGLIDLLDTAKGIIVAGNGVDRPDAVQALADATGWPVLADPLSGCQTLDAAVVRFDAILRHPAFAVGHRPAAVLQLGMPPASKVLSQWLKADSGAKHVAVSPIGLVSDPNLVGARQVHAPVGALCTRLAARATSRRVAAWRDEWIAADRVAREVLDAALKAEPCLSEPGTARAVTAHVPPGGHLVVASSMPIRDVEWFGTPRGDITVHSNRGANGIDGVTGHPTVVVARQPIIAQSPE